MKNRILAALQGEYDKHDLPKVGTVMDDVYKVIFCPVCGNKTLDNYYICHHCGWEYDGFPEYHYSAANGATLHEYRRAYEKLKKGENYMQVSIYSRQAIIELMKTGFPENTAVISFYSPQKISKPEKRVDFSGSCDRVFYVRIPDIDIEILHDHGYTYDTYLSEADDLVKFIYEARNDGLNIICQCDYGQSRSAACAAAILQHFEGRGIDIFADYRYYPNQLVYHKVIDALEKISRNENIAPMFFITCFEKCEKDEIGCFVTGDTRTFGYFDNLETCIQALNESICDMHECLYKFAVIESIGQGIHPHAKEISWFRWNDEKQGFFEIEKPECPRNYSNYALG